jgi:hypothetical protein
MTRKAIAMSKKKSSKQQRGRTANEAVREFVLPCGWDHQCTYLRIDDGSVSIRVKPPKAASGPPLEIDFHLDALFPIDID